MRLFYLLIKLFIPYSLAAYFPRQLKVNPPKSFFGRTIYVSNHAGSFMDPFIAGILQNPILFFMTRSDVFTPLTKPILWGAHMLPIYRQKDGVNTNEKNAEVFKECSKLLKGNRNLLIYGEGTHDDIFVRRIKPIKKGAVRIGFGALEDMNWSKKVYIAALGINYGHPNHARSEVIIRNSNQICLNDYKEEYFRNPSKVVNELTLLIEQELKNQVIHVEEYDWAFFLENVSRLKRNGLNPLDFNIEIPLEERWQTLKKFADWLNGQDLSSNQALIELKKDIEEYLKEVESKKILQKHVYEYSVNKKTFRNNELLYLITLWPIAILGLVHCYVPYIITKKFVEKTFKLKVFWGSVKIIMGSLLIGLFNVPIIILLNKLLIHNAWIALLYYLISFSFGICAYVYFKKLNDRKMKKSLSDDEFEKLKNKRDELIQRIDLLIPFDK